MVPLDLNLYFFCGVLVYGYQYLFIIPNFLIYYKTLLCITYVCMCASMHIRIMLISFIFKILFYFFGCAMQHGAPGAGDGQEAWRAAVHGVAKSWTRLSD